MADLNVKEILQASTQAFELAERVNFETVWDDAGYMCRPTSTASARATRGQSLINNRLISTGINALNTFTSGLTSTLTPKGTRFVNYTSTFRNNEVNRWLADGSQTVMSQLMQSNFFSEISKCFSDLGLIGTASLLTEFDTVSQSLRFKTLFIDRFAFTEGADGLVKNTFIKYTYTKDQFNDKYPDANVRDKDEYTIIQMITPRNPRDLVKNSIKMEDKPFRSVHVLADGEGEILLDEGYDQEIISICRWGQASNEIYGRSPAIEALDTLNMLNAMEASKSISAQRLANPQWLVSDSSGVRNLNGAIGGVVYWNGSNPQDEPKQLGLKDQPQMTDAFMQQHTKSVEDTFFINVWAPLDGIGKQATATEIDRRVTLARQNLVPRINIVVEQLLQPTFNTVFGLLIDNNIIPTPPIIGDIPVTVEFSSTSASILKQMEAQATMGVVQQVEYLATMDPTVLDKLNIDAIADQLFSSANIPSEMTKTDKEVIDIRDNRQKVEDERAKAEQQAQAQAQISELYQKGTKAPEEGSMSQMALEQEV